MGKRKRSLWYCYYTFALILLWVAATESFLASLHKYKRRCSFFMPTITTSRARVHAHFDTYSDQQQQELQEYAFNYNTNHSKVLWSYISNLQKVRRDHKLNSTTNTAVTRNKLALTIPVRSLVLYLKSNVLQQQHNSHIHNKNESYSQEVVQLLTRACVQAIRIAASVNDYRSILRLIDAVKLYNQQNVPARLVGEAVRGLAQTSVRFNKIQRVWKDAMSNTTVSAHDVNALLHACLMRGKVKAALETYEQYFGVVDAYSLSVTLQVLTASIIHIGDATTSTTTSTTSPLNLQPVDPKVPPICCWQWTKALSYIEAAPAINNYVLSNLLLLNQRAMQIYDDANQIQFLLRVMHHANVTPDIVTCTLLLQQMDAATSLALLRTMQRQGPPPHARAYAAAMSRQSPTTALVLLQEYNKQQKLNHNYTNTTDESATTCVYNCVLHSMVRTKTRRGVRQARQFLYHRMKSDRVRPDTITYNTLLSGMARANVRQGLEVLEEMVRLGIPRDARTFPYALQACCANTVKTVLERALQEKHAWNDSGRQAATDIMNAALLPLARDGDLQGSYSVITTLIKEGAFVTAETTTLLISGMGNAGKSHWIPNFLLAMNGDVQARHTFVDVPSQVFSVSLMDDNYIGAVRVCLTKRDFASSRQVLALMRKQGLGVSPVLLTEIAKTYARLVLNTNNNGAQSNVPGNNQLEDSSTAQACKAFTILQSLEGPPASLVSLVAKACGKAGAFSEARVLLKQLHLSLLSKKRRSNLSFSELPLRTVSQNEEVVLPSLHRSLMKSCAQHGNVTAALLFCDDYQQLAGCFAKGHNGDTKKTKGETLFGPILAPSSGLDDDVISQVAMQTADWKNLIIAARRSGHWKVCLSTLQFIQPSVELTHPSLVRTGASIHELNQAYTRLSSMLSSTVNCLAIRSQYAWIIRVLDDWIQWSGRRPPKQAVFAAIRVLTARGKAREVVELLRRCLAPCGSVVDGPDYETALFVSAVSSLHAQGLYNVADEVFILGASRNNLPLNVETRVVDGRCDVVLDLHGLNIALARSAVRVTLQREFLGDSWNTTAVTKDDLIIVTGRGRRSSLSMRPVLRPEVQRALIEEFFPPLSSTSVPGNIGALCISGSAIRSWLDHQNTQKGAHMMTLAAALKSLSSAERLRSLLATATVKPVDSEPRG
jgi:pentatricopeptide repeat protein